MRQNLTLFLFVLCVCIANGQTSQLDCARKLAVVDSLILANDFAEAEKTWTQLRKECEKITPDFYVSGEKILKYNLEMASADDKSKGIENLVALYDQYDLRFPSNKNGNAVRKAMLYHDHKLSSRTEIFKLLNTFFKNNSSQFTDAEALYLYFDIYFENYSKGEATISFDEIYTAFHKIQSHVTELSADTSPIQQNTYKNLSQSLDALFAPAANCTQLLAYYKDKLESNKTDANWLLNASDRLSKSDCTIDPFYLQIAEISHQLKPNHKTAYHLAVANFRARDLQKAAQYYEQSAKLNDNPIEKADIYYTMAASIYMSTDKAKAKEYLQKTVQNNPQVGRAYLVLAQLYGAASECGATPFEKKAVNWLAAETALKAGITDARLKAASERVAENYRKKAPSSAEIKEAKMAGKTIAFKCWINESVVVPKK